MNERNCFCGHRGRPHASPDKCATWKGAPVRSVDDTPAEGSHSHYVSAKVSSSQMQGKQCGKGCPVVWIGNAWSDLPTASAWDRMAGIQYAAPHLTQ